MNIKSGLGLKTKIDVLSNKISSLNWKKTAEALFKMQTLKKCKHTTDKNNWFKYYKSLKLYYLNICFLLFWCLKNSKNKNENNIYKDLNIIKLSLII